MEAQWTRTMSRAGQFGIDFGSLAHEILLINSPTT